MSFDLDMERHDACDSLNPFGTGQCLSTIENGEVVKLEKCLNPFGTGQCLSTQ